MRLLRPVAIVCAAVVYWGLWTAGGQANEPAAVAVDDLRIRDPYIVAYQPDQTYLLYARMPYEEGKFGVQVYASKDWKTWTGPRPVLTLPNNRGIVKVWAPEVHEHRGQYYMFVTLTFDKPLTAGQEKSSDLCERGVYIYRSASPYGPFEPLKATAHTPAEWMALDGTLYVEDGVPYMVFCHEWVQLGDGTMDYVRLKDDLSDVVGRPQKMFAASDVPGGPGSKRSASYRGVTDGCFLYRSPASGKLFMIWSTFTPRSQDPLHRYCVVLAESASGKLAGPWKQQRLLLMQDGGHGMLFRTFDGRLLMPVHQPNILEEERLHLFELVDRGQSLDVVKELSLRCAPGT